MTEGGSSPDRADQAMASLRDRLAAAEETLRALRAGEADAIVMADDHGAQKIYTLETEDRPYRRLVERMSEGAALVDANCLIVYANQWLATLLGVPLDRLQGSPFSDWLDEPERPGFSSHFAAIASGEHHEHTLRQGDGGTVPTLVGVSDTAGPEGVLRCVTVTDLSQQKAQQQQLDRLNAALYVVNTELVTVNETIRGFTAIAAHDLRSPLVSIIGFSTILTEKWTTLSERDRRKYVAIIDRKSHDMSGLIDAILTVSKIEGGALDTRPEQIMVAETIRRCVETTGDETAGVSVSCSPDLFVHADPQHLERILDNYLQNALKYGEPPIRIEAARLDDMIEIWVRDHGPGVPPEFEPRLFDKFARADTQGKKGKKGKKGTGLGLSIVRGLAEANGGQARYEPHAPHGSCFIVALPAGDGPPG